MAERCSIFWLRKESAGERWSVKMQALNKLNVMRAVCMNWFLGGFVSWLADSEG